MTTTDKSPPDLRTAAQALVDVLAADPLLTGQASITDLERWLARKTSTTRALRLALAQPEPATTAVPDEVDAAALRVVLELAESNPLVRPDEATSQWCVLCGAEAPGGADTLARSQHFPGCIWVTADELAEAIRGPKATP